MEAAKNGNVDICRLLLNHGADIHASNTSMKTKYTALHYAACSGEIETAAVLLEHGAMICDSTKPWYEQKSPIRVAIKQGNSDMLSFLMEYCSKMDVEIPLQSIFIEATHKDSEECAIIVLKQGYYPMQIPSNLSIRTLQMAARRGLVKLMSLLVELNPHLMQEDWLIQKQFPGRLTAYPDFCDWLIEYRKQPPCLQKLCRSVVLSVGVILCTKCWGASSAQTSEDISHSCGISYTQ